jgi:hypothetical protein
MEPMGHLNRRPLEVHGFTLATLNTWVELPDRYAKHPKDAPLLVKRSQEQTMASVLPSLSKRSEHSATVVRLGLTVAKDHLSPPANGPKTNCTTLNRAPRRGMPYRSAARTTQLELVQLVWIIFERSLVLFSCEFTSNS